MILEAETVANGPDGELEMVSGLYHSHDGRVVGKPGALTTEVERQTPVSCHDEAVDS